jgi:hypothetical protein
MWFWKQRPDPLPEPHAFLPLDQAIISFSSAQTCQMSVTAPQNLLTDGQAKTPGTGEPPLLPWAPIAGPEHLRVAVIDESGTAVADSGPGAKKGLVAFEGDRAEAARHGATDHRKRGCTQATANNIYTAASCP